MSGAQNECYLFPISLPAELSLALLTQSHVVHCHGNSACHHHHHYHHALQCCAVWLSGQSKTKKNPSDLDSWLDKDTFRKAFCSALEFLFCPSWNLILEKKTSGLGPSCDRGLMHTLGVLHFCLKIISSNSLDPAEQIREKNWVLMKAWELGDTSFVFTQSLLLISFPIKEIKGLIKPLSVVPIIWVRD